MNTSSRDRDILRMAFRAERMMYEIQRDQLAAEGKIYLIAMLGDKARVGIAVATIWRN